MGRVWRVLFFCVLLSGVAAQQCPQIMERLVDQGVDPQSFDRGAGYSGRLSNVSSSAECMEACCKMEDCHLALAQPSSDGLFACLLLSCRKGGQDVCSLSPASGDTVYLKKETAPESGDSVRSDTAADRCRSPMEVGFCRAAFPRFYYDVTNQTCKMFIYGGCAGNQNNFENIEDCQAACSGVTGFVEPSNATSGPAFRRMLMNDKQAATPEESQNEITTKVYSEHCEALPDQGFCRAAFQRYFYNASARTCQLFTYGGCKGNKNNYLTMEECMADCSGNNIPNAMKSTDDKDACTAAYDAGRCRASFPRFYFDPKTKTCLPFIYGGCGGNSNRYSTVTECMSRCTGAGGQHEHHSSHPNPAFFLVATLAIMSTVLLVGFVLLWVQRARARRQTHDDKEELLPEDKILKVTSA
ncbi:kunitz-type protease inhibitor 2 [Scleropages formosus]|uniref:Serine peptidase inhibitor, Kunitz type, 2 n=1 Tax=Scleropages formosus TaxID=113540 RepID=A0A8C9RCD2_SCLFO|nr:kunitz-type protease inhibitor 2-like [Scleropages formosus]